MVNVRMCKSGSFQDIFFSFLLPLQYEALSLLLALLVGSFKSDRLLVLVEP